jgi:YVTN family beta-propeller protein
MSYSVAALLVLWTSASTVAAQTRVFVTNFCLNCNPQSSVSVIDTTTNQVAANIPMPNFTEGQGIAPTPDGRYAHQTSRAPNCTARGEFDWTVIVPNELLVAVRLGEPKVTRLVVLNVSKRSCR